MADQSNSKRLAKNTMLMYFRMGFLMLISLYTSRVILQQLGVEDYGIYNLVGSVVLMFVSLKSIFSSSTQRFLNYEMGKGNYDKLQLIYTMSTAINAIIAVIFVVLVETVGLWFLNSKINVDPARVVAAHWVFQFSVVSTVISIMSTPLDACVIAHERMDFYAYLSIFEGLARLGICYLLAITSFDKLILYGFLTFMISVIVRIVNQMFCMKQFDECHLKRCWDKEYFVKMSTFAGWAFFGNTANILGQNGLNMVLNVFGGPLLNAARGISYQVQGAVSQFISNIVTVVKPYAVKTYASGDYDKAIGFAHISSKLYFTIQMMLVIFVTFLAERLIQLWLGQIPEYVIVFLDLVMIQMLVRSLHMPIDFLFAGEGNIKYYQLYEGIILALPVPMTYVFLKAGLPYYSAFVSLIICEVLHITGIALLARKICHLHLRAYFKEVIVPVLICILIYGVMFYLNTRIIDNLMLVITNVIVSMFIISALMYFVGFSNDEKKALLSVIKKR